MAKQSFVTGQVLTAAQMTSLQETAMGGGPATAKTASYVLVAADAGTTVAMNAAGATTITVNTGLFAAGDTVFIQNLGAGACTVTAGTATVATAGSLILPQNDAGILYFTATGAAIFYDYIQAGAVSPLTTKGDLYTFSTSDARLGVGANGTTLVADSSEATGLKWATPAAGGGITLLSTTTLSGASVTVSSISQDYQTLYIVVNGITVAAGTSAFRFSTNSSTNLLSDYKIDGSTAVSREFLVSYIQLDDGVQDLGSNTNNVFVITIDNYSSTSMFKTFNIQGLYNGTSSNGRVIFGFGGIASNTAITSITAATSGNSYNAGTIKVYGVK